MAEIKQRPWAKVNLYLRILGRRDDGYHQVETFIVPIALHDELVLKHISSGLSFSCEIEDNLPGSNELSAVSKNLCIKTAELFFSKIKEYPAVSIKLVKHIPIAGGLGGGSSDAASVLCGLNKLWDFPLKEEEMHFIASSLGADVPFFLGKPQPAICTGRGELINKSFGNNLMPKFFCVLVNPGKGLQTAMVYKEFSKLSLTEKAGRSNILSFCGCINNVDDLSRHIVNDLQEPAVNLLPELRDIMEALDKAGALRSFVSGSGGTVCGLAKTEKEALEIEKKVRNKSKNWWLKTVSTL